jgi:ferrous-iron efflux pump FieF
MRFLDNFCLNDRKTLVRFTIVASVSTAFLLMVAKAFAWKWSGALSIQASLWDSLGDFLISFMNLFVIRYSMSPADFDHQFGHGKAEAIASLAQIPFLVGSGGWVVFQGLKRCWTPEVLHHEAILIWVMVLSIVLTAGLTILQDYAIRRTRSLLLSTDHVHYKSDLYMNLGILCGIFCSCQFKLWVIDSLIGLGIGLYILYSSLSILRDSLNMLMDRELSEATKNQISEQILMHPLVKRFHHLRTYRVGHHEAIQFHLDLDPTLSLQEAHRISDEVEENLYQIFPHADVLIHIDPYDCDHYH